METFTEFKELVNNPPFKSQRMTTMAGLTDDMIDPPIVKTISDFNMLPFCFTLQSCCGHFLYNGQKDPYNFAPLPNTNNIASVEYRIAYIALCIENSASGKRLLKVLKKITSIDQDNVQFGCAEWFWKRQVNSYVVQVEPDRFKHEDQATLGYKDALHVEDIRNKFFDQLKRVIEKTGK